MALEVLLESSDDSSTAARRVSVDAARRMAVTAMLLDFKVLIQSAFRGSHTKESSSVSVTDRRNPEELDPFEQALSLRWTQSRRVAGIGRLKHGVKRLVPTRETGCANSLNECAR